MKLNRKIAATAFGVLALGAAGASLAGAASAASPTHAKAPAISRQATPPAPDQTDEQGADPTTGPDHDGVQQGDQKGADNEPNENGQTESAHDTDSAHEDGPNDAGPEAG